MADIEAISESLSGTRRGAGYLNVTNADQPLANPLDGGKFSYTVEGIFGGATMELLYSKSGNNFHSIDTVNLIMSDNGTYNIEIAKGFIKPVRVGGDGTTNLNVYVTPIALEDA